MRGPAASEAQFQDYIAENRGTLLRANISLCWELGVVLVVVQVHCQKWVAGYRRREMERGVPTPNLACQSSPSSFGASALRSPFGSSKF